MEKQDGDAGGKSRLELQEGKVGEAVGRSRMEKQEGEIGAKRRSEIQEGKQHGEAGGRSMREK